MIYERNMQVLQEMGIEGWLDLDVGARCPIAARDVGAAAQEKK